MIGDFKLVKADNGQWDTWEQATGKTDFNNITTGNSAIGKTLYGNVKQYIKDNWIVHVNAHNSGKNYIYYEKTLQKFEEGKYSALEFNLGFAENRTTNTTGDYFGVEILTQGSGGLSYSKYYIYQGVNAQKIVMPLDPQAYRMQFKFTRYHSDGTTATTTTREGDLIPQISGMKMYKNVKAATTTKLGGKTNFYNKDSNTNFPGYISAMNQYSELRMTDGVADYTVTKDGKDVTMRGNLMSKVKGAINTTQDGRNGYYNVGVTYMTGRMTDRYRGYVAIPNIENNTRIAATADDYVRIYGCKYKLQRYNINIWEGLEETLLYEAKGMQNGFSEYFDIDVSDYDCIKVVSHMPCDEATESYTDNNGNPATRTLRDCRYVGIFNASTISYGSDKLEAGYFNNTEIDDSRITVREKVAYVQSQAAREAGTAVAVVYAVNENGHVPVDFIMNNNALLGSGSRTITRRDNGTQAAKVINPAELDLSAVPAESSYVKVYYKPETVAAATNLQEAGMTEENLLGTYMLSSEYTNITGAESVEGIEIGKGTLFEDLPLPSTVSVTAGENTYNGIRVEWSGNYDNETAGDYTLSGTLNAEDLMYRNLKNDSNFKASITVTVSQAEVKTEESIEKTVNLGGGGFVSGITFHPLDSNLAYARTDVGGAYRYDASKDEWVCITDWLPHDNMYGIDAIAVDPSDADTVYIVAGMYWYKAGHAIYKSTDRGETWTDISFTSDSRVFSGNSVNRAIGESFAVDPSNSNNLYCGTRTAGLWMSKDGGASWTQTTLPYETDNSLYNDNCTGVRAVEVAEDGTIYAGLYQSPSAEGGVYKSTNGGSSWELIEGSPAYPVEVKLFDGKLYVASGKHLVETADASFSMYDTAQGTWSDMTPSGYSGVGSFDVYENNGEIIIYLAEGSKQASLFRKAGEGEWQEFKKTDFTYDTEDIWFKDTNSYIFAAYAYTGDVEINVNGGKADLWLTDGGVGVWKITDIENSKTLKPKVNGIEVTYTTSLAVPASEGFEYQLMSANVDYGIIRTTDIDNSAAAENYRTFANNLWFGKPRDIDIAYSNGKYAAFTLLHHDYKSPSVALSSDGGKTFNYSDAFETSFGNYFTQADGASGISAGNVALGTGANGEIPNVVVSGAGEYAGENDAVPVVYSDDFGASWRISQYNGSDLEGVGSGFSILDGDKVDGDVFYLYNPINGQVYTSTDGGANFTMAASSLIAGADCSAGTQYRPMIKAKPGTRGEVWISNSRGLYKSTDLGVTWAKVSTDATVNQVKGFSFGKGAASETPAVFVVGSVEGTFGVFRSDDNGQSWVKINDEISCKITVAAVEADMQNFGRVYVGAAGRGIYCFDVAKRLDVTENANGKYVANIINRKGAQNMTAVSALYVDGVLKGVTVGDSAEIDGTGTLTVARPAYEGEGTVQRKVFIWDSLTNMVPVFGAVEK